MKKLSLLFCAVLASATLLATPAVQRQAVKANINFNVSKENSAVQMQVAAKQNVPSLNLRKIEQATAAMETDTMLALYRTPYQFSTGIPSYNPRTGKGGIGYDYGAYIVLPFADSVLYYNAYNLTPEWELPSTGSATGASIKVEAGEYAGAFDIPTLSYNPNIIATSDTTQILFNPYTFGSLWNAPDASEGMLAPDYIEVTQAGYYSEYSGCRFGDGWGWNNIWGAAALGNYSYGTKIINPWIAPTTETIETISPYTGADTTMTVEIPTYFDSIVSVIYNAETMYIGQINVAVWTASDTDEFFPDSANDVITMTILPIKGDTAIDWENPIATTTAGKADYAGASSWLGTLAFKFYKVDPVAGTTQQVPVIVDGSFAVVFSGLSKNTTDLGFVTDVHSKFPDAPEAATYFADYSEGELALETLWTSPNNILMSFASVWPSIQGIPEEIKVPLEGAEITVTLPTNVWAEDLEIESDDWIEVEAVTEESDAGDFLFAIDVTLTVEESDIDREGLIEIDALGKIYEVVVKQTADAPSAIENAVKVVNDGKLYNVLGIEVDEDYKGVVIRNGEKFLQR